MCSYSTFVGGNCGVNEGSLRLNGIISTQPTPSFIYHQLGLCIWRQRGDLLFLLGNATVNNYNLFPDYIASNYGKPRNSVKSTYPELPLPLLWTLEPSLLDTGHPILYAVDTMLDYQGCWTRYLSVTYLAI
jgi:hypothetical protein